MCKQWQNKTSSYGWRNLKRYDSIYYLLEIGKNGNRQQECNEWNQVPGLIDGIDLLCPL